VTILRKAPMTGLTILLMVAFITVSGCTKYASQDDLQRLQEARQAALSAEKELDKLTPERKSLEEELSRKQQELLEAQQELENVKKR